MSWLVAACVYCHARIDPGRTSGEYHDLENARHALEAAIGGVGVAVSRLVDDRPQSEWKPEFTIEELLAMGDDAPTQTWDGDDPVILDLPRL